MLQMNILALIISLLGSHSNRYQTAVPVSKQVFLYVKIGVWAGHDASLCHEAIGDPGIGKWKQCRSTH